MKAKHTPGPWIGSTQDYGIYIREPDGSYGPQIASILEETCEVEGQNDADLALIAAAPELLAALEDLLSVAQGQIDSMDYDDLGIEKIIAKAKGGTA